MGMGGLDMKTVAELIEYLQSLDPSLKPQVLSTYDSCSEDVDIETEGKYANLQEKNGLLIFGYTPPVDLFEYHRSFAKYQSQNNDPYISISEVLNRSLKDQVEEQHGYRVGRNWPETIIEEISSTIDGLNDKAEWNDEADRLRDIEQMRAEVLARIHKMQQRTWDGA